MMAHDVSQPSTSSFRLRHRKRLWGFGAVAGASIALSIIAYAKLEQNLVYYWTPQELYTRGDAAKNTTIRLGGMVRDHSIRWNAQTMQLRFKVGMDAQGPGPVVEIISFSAPPQMLREGIGVVVEGRYDGVLFHAERLMTKHSSEYHPSKEGYHPHENTGEIEISNSKP